MLYRGRDGLELCFGEYSNLDGAIKDVVDTLQRALREIEERAKGQKVKICGLCLDQLCNVRAYALQVLELVKKILEKTEVEAPLSPFGNP